MKRTAVIGIREGGALDLVQALLRQGVSVRIQVSGASMRPLLAGGETVELSPVAGRCSSLKLGDILFLRDQKGNPLLHRLIWRRRSRGMLYVLTKGDACTFFDGFVPAEQVIGRVDRVLSADNNGPAEPSIDLQMPLMRLQACLIVSRALGRHVLRRLKLVLTGQRRAQAAPMNSGRNLS